MSLPPEVQVHATRERVLYRLPHRRLDAPGGLTGCLVVGGAFSLLILGLYVGLVLNGFEKGIFSGIFTAVFALPLGLIGFGGVFLNVWMALGGRSELLLCRSRLLLREKAGPLLIRRSIETARILRFRAHLLNQGRAALDIDVQGGGSRRWAVDYPPALIEALAAELARRKDELSKGAPAGPADVEIAGDVLRMTVLPSSTRRWLSVAIAIGLGLWTLLWAGLLAVAADDAPDHLAAAGIAIGVLWVSGFLGGLAGLSSCRRRVLLESSGRSLRVETRDLRGRRVREWPRSDIWGFEVDRGLLQLRTANGRRPTLLSGREAAELEWIAGILRRGAPRKDVQVLSTASVQGTCQVCATAMEERVVWCRRCRTPHHRECWTYTGMCSTFGCREIGYEERA